MSNYQFPNPYDLLGLTANSTQVELKKSYYQLSLLCHPDKGGQKEDMMILHRSYQFIKEQFNKRDDEQTTYQKLEDSFADFCKEQETEKPPSWSQIYQEANDWLREFNRNFELEKANQKEITNQLEDVNNFMGASFNQGYGAFMEQSEPEIHNRKNYEGKIEDSTKKLKHQFERQVQVYQEPQTQDFYGENVRLDVSVITNFTSKINSVTMTDYKEAFTPAEEPFCEYQIIDEPAPSIKETNQKLDQLIRQRNEMDEIDKMTYDFTPDQYQTVTQKLAEIQKKLALKVSNLLKEEFSNPNFQDRWGFNLIQEVTNNNNNNNNTNNNDDEFELINPEDYFLG